MTKYQPNYLTLIPVALLYPPLVYLIINQASVSSIQILFALILAIVGTLFIVLKLKMVYFLDDRLKFTYPLYGAMTEIKYSDIRGITYQFHYEKNYHHQWKLITLITNSGKTYIFRRILFNEFTLLEFNLLSKFKQLKKIDLTELNEQEFADFQRENKYFDIQKAKRDRTKSLVVLVLIMAFRFLALYDSGIHIILDSILLLGALVMLLRLKNSHETLRTRKNG